MKEQARQLATLLRQACARFDEDMPRIAGIAEAAADGIDAELAVMKELSSGARPSLVERVFDSAAIDDEDGRDGELLLLPRLVEFDGESI